MIVGIDLDNTIVKYDTSLYNLAVERGLVSTGISKNKRVIRDAVRDLYGDEEWQKLQLAIYGDSIEDAELMPSVWSFLRELKKHGHTFMIVSHKTKYPNYGDTKVNLRSCALRFLEKNNFFSENGLCMSREDVFFLSTREEKVKMIKELNIDLFIDDLEEVFQDSHFPVGVKKVLFSFEKAERRLPGAVVLSSFNEISEYVLERDGNGVS
ncbi:MAG: hypothetical protein BA863_16385 [Desulfovibrio sp. S3730MH75]|nr:MAG: hypothetical protein BA863_16385 [Desulfovibrio sp. S3730MH75]